MSENENDEKQPSRTEQVWNGIAQVGALLSGAKIQAQALHDMLTAAEERLGALESRQAPRPTKVDGVEARAPRAELRVVPPVPVAPVIKQISQAIERAEEHAEEPEPQAAADGTGEYRPPSPVPTSPRDQLRAKIEAALMKESLTPQKLAAAIAEPIETVIGELKALRSEHKVYNVGMAESPCWTWRIGDHPRDSRLKPLVKRLIMERPMTARNLADATGASMTRVGGALVDLQRAENVIGLSGGGHTKLYFIISERVKDMRLPPKVNPNTKNPKKK